MAEDGDDRDPESPPPARENAGGGQQLEERHNQHQPAPGTRVADQPPRSGDEDLRAGDHGDRVEEVEQADYQSPGGRKQQHPDAGQIRARGVLEVVWLSRGDGASGHFSGHHHHANHFKVRTARGRDWLSIIGGTSQSQHREIAIRPSWHCCRIGVHCTREPRPTRRYRLTGACPDS